jgi:hypothetical protein
MGELIAFKARNAAMRPGGGLKHPAAILFFTGVRREIIGVGAPSSQRLPVKSGKAAGKPSGESRGASESGA